MKITKGIEIKEKSGQQGINRNIVLSNLNYLGKVGGFKVLKRQGHFRAFGPKKPSYGATP